MLVTALELRELPMGEPPPPEDPSILEELDPSARSYLSDYEDFDETAQNSIFDKLHVKEALETGLNKLQSINKAFTWNNVPFEEYPIYDRRIHFILPLMGRLDKFTRFMTNYEDIILKSDEAVTLIVVLYLDSKNPLDYRNSESLIDNYNEIYGKDIKVVRMGTTTFSRGAALTEGVKQCSGEDLMFFIDVDMMFNFITLRRIRMNTIKYYQVYFPIVFSEYNPEVVNGDEFNRIKGEPIITDTGLGKFIDESGESTKSELELANEKYTKPIHDDYGYFRLYGFGILSIYKCDFERVSGFDLSIKGWGLEDVQLFETLIKSNLTVFRIADDSLVHKYHSVECDKNLEKNQYQMCLGTKASTYGSERHMVTYMLNHPEILWPDSAKEKGAS